MTLIYIYEDLHALAIKKHPKQKKKQRAFGRNLICAQLGICTRSERRQRCSAYRIQFLTNAGITFDLLAKVLNVSDLETTDFNYNIFLENLKLNDLKNLFQDPISVARPNLPNTLIRKINEHEQLECELNMDTEDSDEDDDV